MSPRSTKIAFILVALAGLALAGPVLAQPEQDQAPARPRRANIDRAREDAQPNPEAAKQRLRRMIEQNKQRGERLEEALRAIEAGKDPLEVMREMVERNPERARGPADGPPGEDGPPPPQGEGRRMPAPGQGGEGPMGQPGHPQGEGNVDRELGGLGNVLEMPGRTRALSDDEREKVKAVLRQRLPRVADRFEQLAVQEPKMAKMLLDRVGARVQRAESMREQDPQVADLRLKEIELGSDAITFVRDWRKAKRASDAPALEKAGAELKAAISDLFDVRVKLRESELREVSSRLEQMRGDLGRFQAERQGVVDRTFKQMTERGGPGQPGGQGRRGPKGEGKSSEGRQPRPDTDGPPPRDDHP